jgi:hypothetical protein
VTSARRSWSPAERRARQTGKKDALRAVHRRDDRRGRLWPRRRGQGHRRGGSGRGGGAGRRRAACRGAARWLRRGAGCRQPGGALDQRAASARGDHARHHSRPAPRARRAPSETCRGPGGPGAARPRRGVGLQDHGPGDRPRWPAAAAAIQRIAVGAYDQRHGGAGGRALRWPLPAAAAASSTAPPRQHDHGRGRAAASGVGAPDPGVAAVPLAIPQSPTRPRLLKFVGRERRGQQKYSELLVPRAKSKFPHTDFQFVDLHAVAPRAPLDFCEASATFAREGSTNRRHKMTTTFGRLFWVSAWRSSPGAEAGRRPELSPHSLGSATTKPSSCLNSDYAGCSTVPGGVGAGQTEFPSCADQFDAVFRCTGKSPPVHPLLDDQRFTAYDGLPAR